MDKPEENWEFFIDVGGTFTDVVARPPAGGAVTFKLLSSGVVRGSVEAGSDESCIIDTSRSEDPDGFWTGYTLRLLGGNGEPSATVTRFDAGKGQLVLDSPLATPPQESTTYELFSTEEAPITAIRYLMGLGLDEAIGRVDVRLGTTRATNALLERKGAKTAFITTKGFADILKIGNQDRPELFRLDIRKRDELAESAVEMDERLSADGTVLRPLDEDRALKALELLKAKGYESLAVCLLHAHVNPEHEERIAAIAEPIGFVQVSISSQVSRLERIVSRGDTTVVDAYLGPVIRQYVAAIRNSIPDAKLMLMTSAGGLVDSRSISGSQTILSGPAGGVVGCAHVAKEAGFAKTIGFDMGGTSTDVCRIDAAEGFEYQHETVKAGVRIMTPMLAVETVAAGGGSICAFDGQMLTVGPRSAGADPGPACYGRNGPLTVTDLNVFLGRVPIDDFPFPLDLEATKARLEAIRRGVIDQSGSEISDIELAEGFLQIANAKMAEAIKRVSIAKGYDLREYALSSFGGAGGQHACAIARTLGITQVVLSPFAGVLSALGIGAADIKRIAQQSVNIPLDDRAAEAVTSQLSELSARTRAAMEEDGVRIGSDCLTTGSLDLCYAGVSSLITVPAEPFERVREQFEAMHRQLYGYIQRGRPIEIRVARVEMAAPSERPPSFQPREHRDGLQATGSTTTTIFGGRSHEVPIFHRDRLGSGDHIEGPAIVIEETSTVVIEPGWSAIVNSSGDLVLTDDQGGAERENVSTRVDPIQLELFNNQFASIAEQMGTTLRRTALSTNVKERLDFSCAIFGPEGDLVVNAPHMPVHLGAMSGCVKALIEDVGKFKKGDVYVTNNPYRGGSHLNDITIVTPVHDDTGRQLRFFVASRAHHAEIGGTRPGSMPPDSTCLADEGVVIHAFPWIVDGRVRDKELRALLTAPPYPSRTPDENLADVAAQVAANQTGVRELSRMIERYGVEVVHAYMGHIQQAAENKMRRALGRIPDGVHEFEDYLDDGSPIRLAITIEGDNARLDFSGTGGVLPGNLNANRAIVSSAVLYCLRCLIEEDIPLNAGVLEPVRIILPRCLLNPPSDPDPRKCPAVVGGNVETSQRVVDTIFGALKTVAASQGTMNNFLLGNQRFAYYETICGGAGAGPDFDGADAVHTNMTNTRLTDPEVLESRYPVRLVRFEIRRGSGGAGRHRGGDGTIREVEFLEPLDISIVAQRRTRPPYGLCGGQPGAAGRSLLLRKGSQKAESLPSITKFSVEPGDRVIIETPGGGGYGAP